MNVVGWPRVAEVQRRARCSSKLWSVAGVGWADEGVHSRVALRVRDHSALARARRAGSDSGDVGRDGSAT